MKPFCLADALAGKPVVSKKGKKVVELHLWKTLTKFPLEAVLEGEKGSNGYTKDGMFYDTGVLSDYDLFMATPPQEAWVNVYVGTSGVFGFLAATKEQADKDAREDRIACQYINWEK